MPGSREDEKKPDVRCRRSDVGKKTFFSCDFSDLGYRISEFEFFLTSDIGILCLASQPHSQCEALRI